MDSAIIGVAILDDNPKFRKHLVRLLGKETDISVVVEAEPGLAGTKVLEEQKPDVILTGRAASRAAQPSTWSCCWSFLRLRSSPW